MKRTCSIFLFLVFLLVLSAGFSDSSEFPGNPLREKLERAIMTFPESVQGKLREIVLAGSFTGKIDKNDAEYLARKMGASSRQLMLDLVKIAKVYAKPPISKFNVGAVCRGTSGNLYFGSNMEFAGQVLSFSVHGEQSATMNAWMHGESAIDTLAISAAPCGYCRQFLNELRGTSNLTIVIPDAPALLLTDLLPHAFGPGDLDITARLMDHEEHNLALEHSSDEPVVLQALAAAKASYAPYSGNFAGVAILSKDGRVFTGRYAENAAFNPSMSPMQAALSQFNMAARLYKEIERVVLVEVQCGTSGQKRAAEYVLHSISTQVKLEVFRAREKEKKIP